MFDLLIKGGMIVNHDGVHEGDIGIRNGRIDAIGPLDEAKAGKVIEAGGLHVLPGVIDSQVHFREPGLTHKEDLESGSRAAVAGGVTAVFEMPNTSPATTSEGAIKAKVEAGRGRMFCDFAFYAGACAENIHELARLERLEGVAGIKIFMGSSTGSLLLAEDGMIAQVLANISRRAAFHCEDEARLDERKGEIEQGSPASHPLWRDAITARRATSRLLRLARQAGKRVHVLHVSTMEEMELLAGARDFASVEVTPQHLILSAPEAYERLGTLAQMNPPIRSQDHRRALWEGLRQGIVDVIGSDHAPHTLEEKQKSYPLSPSGMPGVQTLLPLMLDQVNAGRLSIERLVDLTSHGVARLFCLAGKGRLAAGYDADITLVDLAARREITNGWIESRCGWTPFDGMKVTGWPVATIVRGHLVMKDGEIFSPATGQPIRFGESLPAAAS